MEQRKLQPEPWLRGTDSEVPAVARAVLHALELAQEDLTRWCANLTDDELAMTVGAIPSVGFQIRHIARSVDRLLTYAEGKQLSSEQMHALQSEALPGFHRDGLFTELNAALVDGSRRVKALAGTDLEQSRGVGRRALPTTVGGLLVHVADHTQRHVGQAITTAKLVKMQRIGQ